MENLLPKSMLGTPRRAVIAGVTALVLATVLLLIYLSHYRSSVKATNAAATVLVAKAFVPSGTTADAMAKKNLWEVTSIPKDQLEDGAITDASVLQGQVALNDIYPASQLTTADFGTTATSGALSGSPELMGTGAKAGTWRAIALPLDEAHGMTPQAQTDDHVDVYAQMNDVMTLLMQNVLVLAAPNQSASNTTSATSGNYILRVPSSQAARFAFLSDNGKLWFVLRPQKNAKPTRATPITPSNALGSGGQ
jgi:Flp pilus assembly protein CpaB